MVPSTRPVAVSPLDSIERAIPKSVTLALPSASIRTFCGFTSRWTSPAAWALARPRPISIA